MVFTESETQALSLWAQSKLDMCWAQCSAGEVTQEFVPGPAHTFPLSWEASRLRRTTRLAGSLTRLDGSFIHSAQIYQGPVACLAPGMHHLTKSSKSSCSLISQVRKQRAGKVASLDVDTLGPLAHLHLLDTEPSHGAWVWALQQGHLRDLCGHRRGFQEAEQMDTPLSGVVR